MDKIKIKDLQVFCHHGVYPEENHLGQKFLVSATLFTNTRKAGLTDDLNQSLHYGLICEDIKKIMEKNTFNLIERVAEYICQSLLRKYLLLDSIKLEVKKPWAPILQPVDYVSVCIERKWHTAYLGIGSNLGDKAAYLDFAVSALTSNEDIKTVKVARYIETEPVGTVEQDTFLNSCIEIKTLLVPEELLMLVNEIEAQCHRERVIHWGPRTLDIDILFYDDAVIDQENLMIPHKEAHNRMFVLEPLSEIAPCYRHPILNKTILELKEERQ